MPKSKVAVTIEKETLRRVDRLVRQSRFPNRSQAIEYALAAQLNRLERTRLADECAKLDRTVEQKLADVGLAADAKDWPEY
jgi:metal-responsive CopG/Arc/MetJ family transcriptional regulator